MCLTYHPHSTKFHVNFPSNTAHTPINTSTPSATNKSPAINLAKYNTTKPLLLGQAKACGALLIPQASACLLFQNDAVDSLYKRQQVITVDKLVYYC